MDEAATGHWELHHVNVEQALIQAPAKEDTYIELPTNYQEFKAAVRKLNRSIDGIVQASQKN